jgi:hypothetical protein
MISLVCILNFIYILILYCISVSSPYSKDVSVIGRSTHIQQNHTHMHDGTALRAYQPNPIPTTPYAKRTRHKHETKVSKESEHASLKIQYSRGRSGSPNEKPHVDPGGP